MVTQFAGALNDNVFKTAISLLITSLVVADQSSRSVYLSLASAAFVAPFVIFSSHSGWLADRYSKVAVMRWAKLAEIFIALLGAYYLVLHQIPQLLLVLFLMGMHSAVFSPCKYGILPEILHSRELSRGNGYLELWTLVAILIGQAFAAPLKIYSERMLGNGGVFPAVIIVAIAVVGLWGVRRMNCPPPANPTAPLELNPLRGIVTTFVEISKDRPLFLSLLAIAYFSLAGQLINLTVIVHATQISPDNDLLIGGLLTALTLGIGAGSLFAGSVSAGKVELGLVPLGVVGISLSCIGLTLFGTSGVISACGIAALGFSGGVFIVPLNAYFQHRTPADRLGRYLAVNNVLSFGGMLLASGVFWLLSGVFGLPVEPLYLLVAIASLGVGIAAVKLLPLMLVRCVNWLLIHTIYRVKAVGVENVPASGGALLVCNHVSYVDPSVLLALLERPIRFLMYRPIYEAPVVRWFAKVMQAIPIAPEDGPKKTIKALSAAGEAIEAGELVGIFAEGALTRIGQLLPFNRGLERIMKGRSDSSPPPVIVPVYLDQLWGSIFSFRDGKFFWKFPRELPYSVTAIFGAPLPADTSSWKVRQVIQELGASATTYRRSSDELLHHGFLRVTKRYPLRKCVADSSGRSLTFFSTAAMALALSRRLVQLGVGGCYRATGGHTEGEGEAEGAVGGEQTQLPQPAVGIFLPPSVGGVLANLAVMFSGGVPVNLNYTAAAQSLASAIAQSGIRTVITSRTFLERLGFETSKNELFPGLPLYMEELIPGIDRWSRVKVALALLLLPLSVVTRALRIAKPSSHSLATVIFSSGSTGDPKGVMLTHRNVLSNVESLYDLFQLKNQDGVMGVLPFFHSFGFTGTLWFPLLAGVQAVYHSNPLEGQTVGELVQRDKLTVLMATPTFLMGYLRKCSPEQFVTLRYVVVGAEKLKNSLQQAFAEKFGITPLEGYGCTELSPVALLNIPNFESRAVRHVGNKAGTVGHPIPGVAVKIVDPDSYVDLPPNTDGLLCVKGPNVMAGYLGNVEGTTAALRDGWYLTGDIARADEDGFVTITDRLSRFSKIAGEMVPHVRIEEELHRVLGELEQVCVVTAVADERKGERLVVLSVREFEVRDVVKQLGEAGLPNLWIPKTESFYKIDSLPLLGSGKLDLRAIKVLARDLAAG